MKCKELEANGNPGQLVGAFGAFYNPYSGDTPAKFEHTINQNVYVSSIVTVE